MSVEDFRKKRIEELRELRTKLEKDISEEYFSVRTGKETNVRKPRLMRKDLAVLNTVITEKEKDKLKDEKKDE